MPSRNARGFGNKVLSIDSIWRHSMQSSTVTAIEHQIHKVKERSQKNSNTGASIWRYLPQNDMKMA